MNVFGKGVMTPKALAAALLSLPDQAIVERVFRDDSENTLAIGMEDSVIEVESVIEITIRLPKQQLTRPY